MKKKKQRNTMSNNFILRHGKQKRVQSALEKLFGEIKFSVYDAIRVTNGVQENAAYGEWSIYQDQKLTGYPDYTFIDCTVPAGMILLKDLMKKKEEPEEKKEGPDYNCIINTNANLQQVNDVLRLAHMFGYDKHNRISAARYYALALGNLPQYDDPMGIYHGDFLTMKRQMPKWKTFNAATDMGKIRKFFVAQNGELKIEHILSAKLIEFIQTTPQNEMVIGFVRRETGVAIPPEVQQKGGDEICKWIVEQQKREMSTT